jgi:RimJ/RimL family protein N-acetyltransferase
MEDPIWNIEGDKIALGPIRKDLLPVYRRWMNDFDVVRTIGLPMVPVTVEAEDEWYEKASKPDEKNVMFAIYERATKRVIGNCGLHHIDQKNRTATYGILIGEKECWGKGYGTETTRLILDYAFNALGLHAVRLHVYSFNERGRRAYERAGFKLVGRLREAKRLGGQVHDDIVMDCLATEFESPVLAKRILA